MVGIMKGMGSRTANVMRKSREKRAARGGGTRFNMMLRFGSQQAGSTSEAIWVHIHAQEWTSSIMERGEVFEEEDVLWHNVRSHFAPSAGKNGMGFTCSSGADRTAPCYGCASYVETRIETDAQVEKIRETMEESKDREKLINKIYKAAREDGLISSSARCVISMLVLEEVLEVPKAGSRFTRKVFKPFASDRDIKNAKESYMYERAEYHVSGVGRDQILALQNQVRCTCASCGDQLIPVGWVCAACEAENELDPEMFEGKKGFDTEIFTNYLQSVQHCACGAKCVHDEYVDIDAGQVPYSVQFACECGDPVEGSICNLALQIAEKKITDTSKEIVLKDWAPLPAEIDAEKLKPLDLNYLKKGDSIESQKKRLGKIVDHLDPTLVVLPKFESNEEEEEEVYE